MDFKKINFWLKENHKSLLYKLFLTFITIVVFLFLDYDGYLNLISIITERLFLPNSYSLQDNHFEFFLNGSFLFQTNITYLEKKIFAIITLIIILVPNRALFKSKFIAYLVGVNFIGVILKLILISYLIPFGYLEMEAEKIADSPLAFGYLLFVMYFLKQNRMAVYLFCENIFNLSNSIVKQLIKASYIVAALSIVTTNLVLFVFEFEGYINLLFSSSAYITQLFGYPAIVSGKDLIGEFGTIHMERYCLGLNTMLVFSLFIFFTGKSIFKRLGFIIVGLILINIINIGRFSALFIYIQKEKGYSLALDVHNLLNLIIVVFIFLLWILWFEKFSDIKE